MLVKVGAGSRHWPNCAVSEDSGLALILIRVVSLVVVMITVAGCQVLGVRSLPTISPLLEPASGDMSVQLNQRMTLTMDERRHHMMMVTRFTDKQTRVTSFTITGQRLLDVVHEDGKVSHWQSEQVDRDIPARWLLTQLQLAYWPEAALRNAYGAPWVFSQDDTHRALHLEDELLVMVSCTAGFRAPEVGSKLTIEHHRLSLVMTIETLKIKNLAAPPEGGNNRKAGQ